MSARVGRADYCVMPADAYACAAAHATHQSWCGRAAAKPCSPPLPTLRRLQAARPPGGVAT